MRDGTGELGAECEQEGFLLFGEAAPLVVADHQHAQHLAMLNNGHTEEGVKPLFAGFRRQNVGRMVGRVFQDEPKVVGRRMDPPRACSPRSP